MSKPWIHAKSSADKFGGTPRDYIDIHDLMDSSKAALADSRHRALTHNAWFVGTILEKIFGHYIVNSEGKEVSVRDIGEQHVLEDFRGRFIPTVQDWFEGMTVEEWMIAGLGKPPRSYPGVEHARKSQRARKRDRGSDESPAGTDSGGS